MKSISAKKLKKLGGKIPFSSITSPKKPIPKSNPRRQAKRKAGYRKLLSGREYRAARAEAMKRAGGQCEGWKAMHVQPVNVLTIGGGITNATASFYTYDRCPETENLHAHHLRYPKSRPLAASDLKILCKWHHEAAESQKMGKTRMF